MCILSCDAPWCWQCWHTAYCCLHPTRVFSSMPGLSALCIFPLSFASTSPCSRPAHLTLPSKCLIGQKRQQHHLLVLHAWPGQCQGRKVASGGPRVGLCCHLATSLPEDPYQSHHPVHGFAWPGLDRAMPPCSPCVHFLSLPASIAAICPRGSNTQCSLCPLDTD